MRREHGPERVRIVSADELILASRWHHHLDGGAWGTEVLLSDGTALVSDEIGGVLNRLRPPTQELFPDFSEEDASYAAMETHALWLSWLASLPCPVMNRPSPAGLAGRERGEVEWLARAGRSGLPTRGYFLSTNARRYAKPRYEPQAYQGSGAVSIAALGRSPALFLEPVEEPAAVVTVVGRRILGAPAAVWDDGLRMLAAGADCDLLEVACCLKQGGSWGNAGDWRISNVSSWVRSGGNDVVQAIIELLETRVAEARRR